MTRSIKISISIILILCLTACGSLSGFSFRNQSAVSNNAQENRPAAEPENARYKDYTNEIIEYLGCDCEVLENAKSPTEIMKEYKKLLAEGNAKCFTPVLVIPSEELLEDFKRSFEGGEERQSIIERSETIDVRALLDELKEQSMSWTQGYDIEGEFTNGSAVNEFYTLIDYSTMQPYKKIIIARIPTGKPWEVAAWIPMGGFNECPTPEEQVAIFMNWFGKYGSVPAVVSFDTWELYIQKPVKTVDEAKTLAGEQFGFCSDVVLQGTETINSLAGTLINSTVWFFWWD